MYARRLSAFLAEVKTGIGTSLSPTPRDPPKECSYGLPGLS
jgi:hypothetical protein